MAVWEAEGGWIVSLSKKTVSVYYLQICFDWKHWVWLWIKALYVTGLRKLLILVSQFLLYTETEGKNKIFFLHFLESVIPFWIGWKFEQWGITLWGITQIFLFLCPENWILSGKTDTESVPVKDWCFLNYLNNFELYRKKWKTSKITRPKQNGWFFEPLLYVNSWECFLWVRVKVAWYLKWEDRTEWRAWVRKSRKLAPGLADLWLWYPEQGGSLVWLQFFHLYGQGLQISSVTGWK